MDISIKPVKQFLDAVDMVLNSNTFLLEFDILSDDMEKELETFLFSDDFMRQILRQDIERDWHNLHYFDNKAYEYKVRSGVLPERNFRLEITQPSEDKREYLIAMLMGDNSKYNFCSFYNTEMKRDKAEIVIDELTDYLSLYTKEWDLYIVQPTFLKSTSKSYGNKEDLKYFEGDYGSDSATIIRYQNKGYLILTNGMD